ncbi:cell envelope integrity protein TolA [Limibacillus sp. MBR-115]|jgi:outer membrane biosynthesis protein TonB|uniref:cell envelope integrity protein TolA n=1 Tax=Limibacillus sp. MBR-115 TaxID=3156465 RepID=UPI003397D89E
MRRAVILSATFHVSVIALMAIGLPLFKQDPLEIAPAVPIEVVTIDDVTTAKPAKEAPPEKPTPRPEPTQSAKAPPPPPPQKSEPPTPPPLPKNEPEPIPEPKQPEPVKEPTPIPQPEPPPQVAEAPPKPEPEPTPLPDPVPAPKEERVDETPSPAPPVPLEKPKPPQLAEKPQEKEPVKKADSSLDSILNNVLKDLKPAAKEQDQPKKDPQPQPTETAQLSSKPMTISEIDAIRRKIEGCWNVPAGARNAENLIVEIRLFMNPDGTVSQAEVVDRARMGGDPFYRAAAESALRAVFRCQPLPVPLKKYDTWRQITMRFDPSKML